MDLDGIGVCSQTLNGERLSAFLDVGGNSSDERVGSVLASLGNADTQTPCVEVGVYAPGQISPALQAHPRPFRQV